MSFLWILLLSFSLSLLQPRPADAASNGAFYQKLMSLTESDYSTLYTNLTTMPVKVLGSVIECAAYALTTVTGKDKTKRSSAFQYAYTNLSIGNGGTCQLGRTPPYVDALANKSVIMDGRSGVHVLMNMKPVASVVLADVFAYVLLNEQLDFSAHPNLGPYNTATYGTGYAFSVLSPVQTFEGQFAATINSNAILQMPFAAPKNFTSLSIFAWYYGVSACNTCPLVSVTQTPYTANTIYLIVNPSNLHFQNLNVANVCGYTVPMNQWTYIGVTYNGATGNSVIYINGASMCPSAGALVASTNMAELSVGYYYDGGSPNYMTQTMASVEVYDTALSAGAVVTAMERSTTTRVQV